ncbi:hypothetical protein PC116_g26259 [Phytophthora cactorum]|nr:hypothetical protein PC116_g26259 [Phytophthora cactorum]
MEWPTWPSDRSQLKKSFSLDDPRWARAKPEMRQERRRTLFAGLQTVSPRRGSVTRGGGRRAGECLSYFFPEASKQEEHTNKGDFHFYLC